MKFEELTNEFINNHKDKIESFQWAVISSISSLFYSEYIRNIKQQQVPTRIVWVPKVHTVRELLQPNSQFNKMVSESLIDLMMEKPLFKKYSEIPEMELFKEYNNNLEILRVILDNYIIPNAFRAIPDTISKKFDLENPGQQLIRESRDIDLFDRCDITDKQFDYIVNETILQWFISLSSINKRQDFPSDNNCVYLIEDEILTIDHENAICPIHVNKDIILNDEVMPLLTFVTNTTIGDHDYQTHYLIKNDKVVFYDVKSNTFNRLTTTELL